MRERIPMSSPDITEEDVQAVAEVVRSGRLSLGPKTKEFEELFAAYVGTRHAVAVSSGTAGLHLAIRALGIGPGDEVLVPSFTFAASVNAILYERAQPVFVDILPDTYCLDPEDMKRKITPRTRAVMVVDVFGHPAEWNDILDTAGRYGLQVIDDACEALGAEYRGKKVGSFGDVAVFAFYPNKQMTTGEGGMIVTDRDDIATLCRCLRNQGRREMGGWLEHEELGYNYRITEMSAALGVSQLRRIEALLANRERVAHGYTLLLQKFSPSIQVPVVRPYVRMSWFVYVIALPEGTPRELVMKRLEERGVPTRMYFPPVHLQPYVRKLLGTHEGMLPVTESVGMRTLALPFYGKMTEEDVAFVVTALHDVLKEIE